MDKLTVRCKPFKLFKKLYIEGEKNVRQIY